MINLYKDNNYKIIVVGVGGTGSHLTSFLTHLIGNDENLKLKSSILLIDGDQVEAKNCKNQKFLLSDVGKNKAETLSDRYSSVYDMEISYIDKYLNNFKDLDNVIFSLSKYDIPIIVSCVDNNKARIIIDNYFNEYKNRMIYIDTGNSGSEGELIGQTVIAYRDNNGVVLPSVSKYFTLDEKEEKTPSCGEILLKNIQNIGANITSATTVFNILNNIISFNTITGDVFTFNASQVETRSLKIGNK